MRVKHLLYLLSMILTVYGLYNNILFKFEETLIGFFCSVSCFFLFSVCAVCLTKFLFNKWNDKLF